MKESIVVLVAEDDVLVRNLIHIVLTRSGYCVLLACDGQEALELSRGYDGAIDVLLTDVKMPRMDGVKLAGTIRAERPATKALLISGKMSSDVAAGSVWYDFLPKPFVPLQLKAKLNELVARDAPTLPLSVEGCDGNNREADNEKNQH